MSYNPDNRCPRGIEHFSNPHVLYQGVPTGTEETHNVARLIHETAEAVANFRPSTAGTPLRVHHLPLVLAHDTPGFTSLIRVYNRSPAAGAVTVSATDDTGVLHGPVELDIAALRTIGLSSRDLELGNRERGLRSGIGNGTGHWRVTLETRLNIEACAYVRTATGSLTSMNVTADGMPPNTRTYHLPFFNPASNRGIASELRIANPHDEQVDVAIHAWDANATPAEDIVLLTLGPREATVLTAQQLERGDPEAFVGRFGDGEGKWELLVATVPTLRPLDVMTLLRTRSGHLANVSR